MHKIIAIILIMFAGNTYSSDCFELAGRDYKIDPDLLRAISWHESRNRVNAVGINPVTGYGSGLMQIDSQHFKELSRYGIKPEHLVTDPCMNIYTGAYYLAIAFKKWGGNMAGCRCLQCRFSQDSRTGTAQKSLCNKNSEHLSQYKKQ